MSDRSSRRRASSFTRGAQLTLLVALLGCTAALGGAVPGALWVLLVSSVAALALAAFGANREGVSVRLPLMGGVLLIAVVLVALQLVPLPPGLLAALSPAASELRDFTRLPHAPSGWRPLTLDVPSTARALAMHVGLFAAFLAAAHVGRYREGRRQLLSGVAGVGALIAAIAVLHLLVDARSLFGLYAFQQAGPTLLTPFGNPNHLAGFLTLTGLCALGLALSTKDRGTSLLWGLAFVAQGATVMLSLSRGGIAFFGIAVVLFGALLLRERTRAGPAVGGLLVGLLAVGSVGAYLAYDQLVLQLETVDTLAKLGESKVDLWPMLARAAVAFPWAGMGRGAFELAFSRFHTQWPDVVFTHAENLPLQLVSEFGLVPGLLLILCALVAFAVSFRVRSASGDRLELAAAAGITGLVLHDLFDFALELAAPATAAVLVLGVLCRPAEAQSLWGAKKQKQRARVRLGLVPALVVTLVIAATGALSLWTGRHHHAQAEAQLLALVKEGESAQTVLAQARPLLERHPADYYLHGLLAQAYSRGEGADPINALAFANRALFLRPLDGDAHRAAARALIRLGHRSQGMLEFRLALQANAPGVLDEVVRTARTVDELWTSIPHQPAPVLQLAHTLNGAGRFDHARALLEKAREDDGIAAHPHAAQLWTLAASWALQAGEPDAALTLVSEAAALDAQSPVVPRMRAEVLARAGKRKEAIETLEEALRQHVGDFDLSLALYAHLLQDGQRHRAREALNRAAPFVGSHAERSRLLRAEGQLLTAEGKKGKALQAYLSASRLQPDDAGLHYETARLYEQLQRPHEAIRAIREATRLEGRIRPDIEAWLTKLEARDRELSEQRARRQALGRDAIPSEILFGE